MDRKEAFDLILTELEQNKLVRYTNKYTRENVLNILAEIRPFQ